MAINLGRMDYRPDLSADDVARFNRLLEAVEHMWDNLQNPAPPLGCNDFHLYLNQETNTVGPVTFNNTVTFGNNVTYGAPSMEFPTYVLFWQFVYAVFYGSAYFNSCVVIAGKAPTAPTTKPTITVGSSGTGAWQSGRYYAKITYVNISGAESSVSPESDRTAEGAVIGGPKLTINLNNTPSSDVSYWRVYITPADGASNSETGQQAIAGQATPYDIPIGTTSWDFPGPYDEGPEPPTPSATQPVGCIVLPTCCGTPTWTGKYGEVAIDMCGATDSCNFTNPTPPIIYVQMTAPTGTNWKGIFDYTAITGYNCAQLQVLTHAANTSGLQWSNVTEC